MVGLFFCDICDDTFFYHNEDLFLAHLETVSHQKVLQELIPPPVMAAAQSGPHASESFTCVACDPNTSYGNEIEFLEHLNESRHHDAVKPFVSEWIKSDSCVILQLQPRFMKQPLRTTLSFLAKLGTHFFVNAYCHTLKNSASSGLGVLILWYRCPDNARNTYSKLKRSRYWRRYQPMLGPTLRAIAENWKELDSLGPKARAAPPPPKVKVITAEQLQEEFIFMSTGKQGKPTFYDKDASFRGEKSEDPNNQGNGHPNIKLRDLQPYQPKQSPHKCSFRVENCKLIREMPCGEGCPIYMTSTTSGGNWNESGALQLQSSKPTYGSVTFSNITPAQNRHVSHSAQRLPTHSRPNGSWHYDHSASGGEYSLFNRSSKP